MKNKSNALISRRMEDQLDPADLQDIKKALLDHMVSEGLFSKDITSFPELITSLLPMMAVLNPAWEGLEGDISFEASSAYKHMHSHVKNQFREKGKYLDRKIKGEIAQRSSQAEAQSQLELGVT